MAVEFQLVRVDQRATLEKARINLRALMRDDNTAESTVMAAIDEVADLRAEMQKTRYKHLQQAKSELTADQIDKLKNMRQDWPKGLRDGKRGRMRG